MLRKFIHQLVSGMVRLVSLVRLSEVRSRRRTTAYSTVVAVAFVETLERREMLAGDSVAIVASAPTTVTSKPVTYTITAMEGTKAGPLSAADILNPANAYAAPFEITDWPIDYDRFHS